MSALQSPFFMLCLAASSPRVIG
uniref:Uncharacterized protein n=1 Tax=Arundo donax TaxID=35708 RepID=A0A0A9BUA8_ARUDO